MGKHQELVHGTTVAVGGRGVLMIGPSGSGKSGIALQLMALGGILVSDDQTILTAIDGVLIASAPDAIKGMIEARGVGIIPTDPSPPVPLHLVVNMGQFEETRLPKPHHEKFLDLPVPCLHKIEAPYFSSAVLLYLKGNAKPVS